MPNAIEPFAPRREEDPPPPPRFVRWRFALAAVLTVALMLAVLALVTWLPPIF
jgi:hypothetical protein